MLTLAHVKSWALRTFWPKNTFIESSDGEEHAGLPVRLNSDGQLGSSLMPVGDWIAPTFNTGWSSVGGSYPDVGYRKVLDMVQLRGAAERSGFSFTIFTLPSGYRPTAGTALFITLVGASVTWVRVEEDGDVVVAGTYSDGEDVLLDVVMFSVE